MKKTSGWDPRQKKSRFTSLGTQPYSCLSREDVDEGGNEGIGRGCVPRDMEKKRKEGWKNRERGKLEGGCIQKDGKRDRWSAGNGTAPEQARTYERLIRNKVYKNCLLHAPTVLLREHSKIPSERMNDECGSVAVSHSIVF